MSILKMMRCAIGKRFGVILSCKLVDATDGEMILLSDEGGYALTPEEWQELKTRVDHFYSHHSNDVTDYNKIVAAKSYDTEAQQ